MNLWVVRADSGKHIDAFRKGGYVAIDNEHDEPYPVGRGKEAFLDLFRKYHPPHTSNQRIGLHTGIMVRFSEKIKRGDYVITPSENSDVLHYGQVLGEYRFEPEPEDMCPYKHRRGVKWSRKPVSRHLFPARFQNTFRCQLTVFGVSRGSDFLAGIGADS